MHTTPGACLCAVPNSEKEFGRRTVAGTQLHRHVDVDGDRVQQVLWQSVVSQTKWKWYQNARLHRMATDACAQTFRMGPIIGVSTLGWEIPPAPAFSDPACVCRSSALRRRPGGHSRPGPRAHGVRRAANARDVRRTPCTHGVRRPRGPCDGRDLLRAPAHPPPLSWPNRCSFCGVVGLGSFLLGGGRWEVYSGLPVLRSRAVLICCRSREVNECFDR